MKTLTQALAKTAAVIEKTVHNTVQEVSGPKPLQDYDLLYQIGSAGPALAWKLYSGRAKTGSAVSQQYPTVCVWVLDKRALSEARVRVGLSKAAEDGFLDLIRADAARLVRLRHPGVVHVVQALDENKNAMAMVTEPLFASVANALGNVENILQVPKELKGVEIGLLEVKHGLLQIAESLNFLHNNARLIHRAISPETVLITSNGAWKLGGFGFAISEADLSNDPSHGQGFGFHYAEYDAEDTLLPLQPSLDYTAPELVQRHSSSSSSIGPASDIFSFGCLAYHLITRKPLLDCHNNLKMYMNNMSYLNSQTFSSIPSDLVPDLQKMLSGTPTLRPTALDFTGSPFFRDDTRLRALRFLDHMLERDNMQKTDFLKALSSMWKDFDSRVLRYKVLPPLCAELRNMVMQPMILPMVLTIAESQDKDDFEATTLPSLVPVLSSASGETLLLLVKHAELIVDKASHEHLVSHILPMVVRAYEDTDPRLQEEVLKRTISISRKLSVLLVQQAILPRVHSLALKTTVAAVRVNALLCLGDMVQILDKSAAIDILQTIQRCTSVDRSAPTLLSTLGLSNSMLKKHGVEFAAEHILPLLTPLLVAQQLNVQQFAKYMLFVKDILRKIEEKRGVVLNDSGIPEVKPSVTNTNGHISETIKKEAPPNKSWDEEWITNKSTNTTSVSQPPPQRNNTNAQTPRIIPSSSSSSSYQTPVSVPPVDIEWPPRTNSISTPQNGLSSSSPNSTIHDFDPFADWPPRPATGGSASIASRPVNNGSGIGSSIQNGVNIQSNNNPNWGLSHMNQANFSSSNGKSKDDIGSIFVSSNKNENTSLLRLAPPPANAVGRGRGRGNGNQGQSRTKSSAQQQPPLLDLL